MNVRLLLPAALCLLPLGCGPAPASDWEVLDGALPERTARGAVVAVGEEILLMGGFDREGDPTRAVWAFDPVEHVWEEWPSLPRAVGGAAAFATESHVVVLGGCERAQAEETFHTILPVPVIQTLSLSDMTWDEAEWDYATCDASLLETEQGTLVVGGLLEGGDPGDLLAERHALLIDDSGDVLQILPTLPQITRQPALMEQDEALVIIGGNTIAGGPELEGLRLASGASEWESIDGLGRRIQGGGFVTLGRQLLVVGGRSWDEEGPDFAITESWLLSPDILAPWEPWPELNHRCETVNLVQVGQDLYSLAGVCEAGPSMASARIERLELR